MPSEAVDIDVGQFVGRRLKDCPVVMGLHELAPVGGRATGGRDGRRFERFSQVREDLSNRPWFGDERNQPDAAGNAVNLPFPDITANELDRLIPSPDTRVLISCTNNFAAAPTALPEKVARATLNHHSFATLVASSYRNVFELAPLVDVASTEIPREGDDAP